MNKSDKEELEKYRAQKRRRSEYSMQFAKDNYKRLVCLLPIDKVDVVNKAKGDESFSSYMISLIMRDLKEKSLID